MGRALVNKGGVQANANIPQTAKVESRGIVNKGGMPLSGASLQHQMVAPIPRPDTPLANTPIPQNIV